MKYYETLDVPQDASVEQIKAAYRILVQLYHPDRLQQANASVRQYAEERLKKINEAYSVLSDPVRRASYDARYRSNGAYWHDPEPERQPRGRRRYNPRAGADTQTAYDEWAHEQANRYADAQEHAKARKAQAEAERVRREADERARRATEEQSRRVRVQGDEMVLNFSPGLWTTLVRVPAGEFTMGANPSLDPAARKNEGPPHSVHVSEFFIGKYPVTNAQYTTFLRATQRNAPAALRPGRETHPVVEVSWDDALAFCKWLTAITGRPFRLPTEAEWEKASRGVDARLYPWGDEWDLARLNCEGLNPDTTVVGQYSPAGDSPYGVADMAGNVWEWCMDWYADRLYQTRGRQHARDPQGAPQGDGCVVRGGAFDSPAKHTRCANRNWYYPFNQRKNVGFRIVAEPV